MMPVLEAAATSVVFMADVQAGQSIQARRLDLGLSVRRLAEEAGVDRGRLDAIEKGANARSTTIRAIEAALTRLERGGSTEAITQVIEMPDGTRVTFTGSPNTVVDAAHRFLSRKTDE